MYATVRNDVGAEGLADALADREDDVRGVIHGISGFRTSYLNRTPERSIVTVSVYDESGRRRGVRPGGGRMDSHERPGCCVEAAEGNVRRSPLQLLRRFPSRTAYGGAACGAGSRLQ